MRTMLMLLMLAAFALSAPASAPAEQRKTLSGGHTVKKRVEKGVDKADALAVQLSEEFFTQLATGADPDQNPHLGDAMRADAMHEFLGRVSAALVKQQPPPAGKLVAWTYVTDHHNDQAIVGVDYAYPDGVLHVLTLLSRYSDNKSGWSIMAWEIHPAEKPK